MQLAVVRFRSNDFADAKVFFLLAREHAKSEYDQGVTLLDYAALLLYQGEELEEAVNLTMLGTRILKRTDVAEAAASLLYPLYRNQGMVAKRARKATDPGIGRLLKSSVEMNPNFCFGFEVQLLEIAGFSCDFIHMEKCSV